MGQRVAKRRRAAHARGPAGRHADCSWLPAVALIGVTVLVSAAGARGHEGGTAETEGKPASDSLQPQSSREIDHGEGGQQGNRPQLPVTHSLTLRSDRARQVLPLLTPSPVPLEQLSLAVLSLDGMPGKARFRDDISECSAEGRIIIEFTALPGAQVSIRLIRVRAGAALQVLSQFCEGESQEFDLDYERLQRAYVNAQKSLSEARAKISPLNEALKSTHKQLQQASRLPERNLNQQQVKKVTLLQLSGTVRDIQRRLRHAHKQAAAAQIRLDAVPKILAFLKQLDKKQLTVRVATGQTQAEPHPE